MPLRIRKQMRRRDGRNGIRFLTFSCYKQLPLMNHPAIRDLFAGAVGHARAKHGFELFAWVAMSNHAHLLMRPCRVTTHEAIVPLAPMLITIKQIVAQRVIARWKSLRAPILEQITQNAGRPRFWQRGGGFDRYVRDESVIKRAVRYIHRNPVEAGLVDRPEDWAWSSVHWWMGRRDALVECDPPPGQSLDWSSWQGYM